MFMSTPRKNLAHAYNRVMYDQAWLQIFSERIVTVLWWDFRWPTFDVPIDDISPHIPTFLQKSPGSVSGQTERNRRNYLHGPQAGLL